MRTKISIVQAIWAMGLLAGCAGLGSNQPGQPDYATDAQTNLQRGNEALEDGDYVEAQQYFEHVKSKYPFAEASKEAELQLAETEFRREKYAEARDLYQGFVKLHPSHPKVDYAAFQAALTHYKQIPSDFFLVPNSYERDQTPVRSSLQSMGEFLRQYPSSPHAAEAKRLLEDLRRRLAQHELEIADFYKRRERWAAVAGRLERVATDYAGVGFDERALFGLHDAYMKLKQPEKAKDALRRIVERLPNTDAAKKAQSMLGS